MGARAPPEPRSSRNRFSSARWVADRFVEARGGLDVRDGLRERDLFVGDVIVVGDSLRFCGLTFSIVSDAVKDYCFCYC